VEIIAARVHDYQTPLQVDSMQLAQPQPGEEVVRLAYAGVNPVDAYNAQGKIGGNTSRPLPRAVGIEASGWLNGKPVLVNGEGLGVLRDGVFANAVIAPSAAITELPDGIDLPKAACLGVAGLTSWNVVRETAKVTSDDRVVVLGAGGGVGLSVVSVASALGAETWGQIGNDAKRDAVYGAGAKSVVVAKASSLFDAVRDFKPTVVIDPLGGEFTPAILEALDVGGRLVIFGTSAGAETNMNLQTLYRSGLQIKGYGGLTLSSQARQEGLEQCVEALAQGKLDIFIDRVMPLADVNHAFGALKDRQITGKIVLDLSKTS
jgi:NADPH:quinone reductase